VGALCEIVDGDRGKEYPAKADFKKSGHCLFLSTKNVRPAGFLFEEMQFIDKEKHERLRKGLLKRGDIVFTSRGTVGNIAYYDDNIKYDCVRINSGMFILRGFDEILEEKYFEWYLRSPSVRDQTAQLKSGTAQPQLPIREFKNFQISFPSKSEQREIAQEVERHFSIINGLEIALGVAKKRAEGLRQAILLNAFKGTLIQ
jgi:type I restriction enzyme S subunit